MPSLVSGKQFQHGRGQQMRGRMAVDFERLGILRWSGSASVASASKGRFRSHRSPLTRATMASSARRGLMERATSMGRVPAGTLWTLPSGRVT